MGMGELELAQGFLEMFTYVDYSKSRDKNLLIWSCLDVSLFACNNLNKLKPLLTFLC